MSATMNWKEPDTKIKVGRPHAFAVQTLRVTDRLAQFLVAVLASNDSAAVKEAKATQIAEYMGKSLP